VTTLIANQAPKTGYHDNYVMWGVAWQGEMGRIMALYSEFWRFPSKDHHGNQIPAHLTYGVNDTHQDAVLRVTWPLVIVLYAFRFGQNCYKPAMPITDRPHC